MKIKNLIEIAKNFIGTKGFANHFDENGNDILKNGDLSCSIFISTILVIIRVIDGVSFTVDGLINRIECSNNFMKINNLNISDLKKGDIIIWKSIDGDENGHVGIYIGDGFAISNMSSNGMPGSHHVIYTGLSKEDKKNRNSEIKSIYRLLID